MERLSLFMLNFWTMSFLEIPTSKFKRAGEHLTDVGPFAPNIWRIRARERYKVTGLTHLLKKILSSHFHYLVRESHSRSFLSFFTVQSIKEKKTWLLVNRGGHEALLFFPLKKRCHRSCVTDYINQEDSPTNQKKKKEIIIISYKRGHEKKQVFSGFLISPSRFFFSPKSILFQLGNQWDNKWPQKPLDVTRERGGKSKTWTKTNREDSVLMMFTQWNP